MSDHIESALTFTIGKRIVNISQNDINRFFSRIDNTSSPHGCWLWTGKLVRGGYGKFYISRRIVIAHRVSWVIHRGQIPKETPFVLHNCPHVDVRRCSNPDHLRLGTNQDNSNDMVKKGMQAKGEKSGPHTQPWRMARGIKSGMAKLNDEKIIEIRRRRATGEKLWSIAKDFGISQVLVSLIFRRKIWKHVARAA